MSADFVKLQLIFWEEAGRDRRKIRVIKRNRTDEVVKALADGKKTLDQIIYFYCHASSADLTAAGGPDSAFLGLTDKNVTLGGLKLFAGSGVQLKGQPLIFINACESAELSPAFYDGFVPYFMSKGARGVVGTECKTPALFAMSWAKGFFQKFLDGESLGKSFFQLRQEFLQNCGNPLGLLYAVHCDSDTRLSPAIWMPSPCCAVYSAE
jgi:hypothetical protein